MPPSTASESEGDDASVWIRAPVLLRMKGAIAHVLAKIESASNSDIVNELATDISKETAEETREFMFHEAVDRYIHLLKQSGINKSPKLQLVQRRADNNVASCRDVLDLFKFCGGFTNTFPRDTLSAASKAMYVVVDLNNNQADGEDPVATQPPPLVELHKKLAGLASECKTLRQELASERSLREAEAAGFCERLQRLEQQSSRRSRSREGTNMTKGPPLQTPLLVDPRVNKGQANSSHVAAVQPAVPPPGAAEERFIVLDAIDGSPSPSGGPTPATVQEQDAEVAATSAVSSNAAAAILTSPTSPRELALSYAEAASTEGPWHTPHRYKSKKERKEAKKAVHTGAKNPPKPGTQGGLRGAPPRVNSLRGAPKRDLPVLYLENIQKGSGDSDASIAGNVRGHARSKQLEVFSVQVVRNHVCNTSVGCRITVSTDAVGKATSAAFWPAGIRCRPWRQRKGRKPTTQRDGATIAHQDDRPRIILRSSRPPPNDAESVFSAPLDQVLYDNVSQGDFVSYRGEDDFSYEDGRRTDFEDGRNHFMDRPPAQHDWWDGDLYESTGAGAYSAERY